MSPKTNFKKRIMSQCLGFARTVYHKLPLTSSFRYSIKKFLKGHFGKLISFTKRMTTMTGIVEEVGSTFPLLNISLFNPFRYGEKFDSYYKKIMGSKSFPALTLPNDPPWYIHQPIHEQHSEIKLKEKVPSNQVVFHIVSYIRNTPSYLLLSSITSVIQQANPNWMLDIWVDNSAIWNVDVLTLEFHKLGQKVRFHNLENPANFLEEINIIVAQNEADYVVFLNSYDELGIDCLDTATAEINLHSPDIFFSKPGQERFNKAEKQSEVSSFDLTPFAQLIGIKKELFLDFFTQKIQVVELMNQLQQILVNNKFVFSVLDMHNYLFRPIPGRNVIRFYEDNFGINVTVSTVPLRVVVDARLIDRAITGTERYILEILNGLSELRHEFNLEIRAISMAKPVDEIDGIEFITDGHMNEILNSHVFHKTFPASNSETLREFALAPSTVFTPHDLIAFNNPHYFPAEENYYNFCNNLKTASQLSDHIIAISNSGKSEIISFLHIPEQKVSVVYHGFNTKRFSQGEVEKDHTFDESRIPADYFFFIGTDYPHKNLLVLLRSLEIVLKKIPTASLVVVGASYYGSPQIEVQKKLESLGDRVVQLGHVPDEALPSLYHHAKALIFPSLYEGFGLPILEAMAFDTPVIAANCTSVPEVCGDAALLFDGYDVNQLADYMIRIWFDNDLRNQLIEAGRKNVEKFNWAKTARQTIKAYQQAIQKAVSFSPDQRMEIKGSILRANSPFRPTIFIVTHVRFFPPTAGNEQRIFKLVKYFKKLGYQIVMLVNPFLENEPLKSEYCSLIHQYVDYYEELGDTPFGKYSSSFAIKNNQSSVLEKLRGTELSFCPDEMMARAKELIQAFTPKVIVAEYIWTSRIFELADKTILKMIDLHDLFSQKKKNVIKFGIRDDLAIDPVEEVELINRGDVALAIQENEAALLYSLHPKCEIITAGIDYLTDFSTYSHAKKKSLLIVGSDNQINNFCVNEFLTDAWPAILEKEPECQMKIIGKVSNSVIGEHQNVELLSYVEDLSDYYREAALVINPVYAGTGLKIKSVEALGYGKVLVSWPEGVSGIHFDSAQPPFCVIHDWKSLVEQIVDLLRNDSKRTALEKTVREFAKTQLCDDYVYRQVGDRLDIHTKREIKILCLYLRYGPDDYPGALDKLINWYREKQKESNVNLTIWVIDNKIDKEFDGIDLATGCRLLSGDNLQREFSGFQKVVDEHHDEIVSFDVIHFVTSAYDQLFTGYRDYFSLNHLYPILHRPICLGHIDYYDCPIQLLGNVSQCWIRTCFFFMSPYVLYNLETLNNLTDKHQFLDDNSNFLDNGLISMSYQKQIKDWLFGKKIQGVSWHGSGLIGDAFAQKTLSILNEHMLSIKLRSRGVQLVDFYWLKKNFKEVISTYSSLIPEAMEQVKERQFDLFNIRLKI